MAMENDFYFEADQLEFKNELIGICRGCLDVNNLKDIFQTYYYRGKPEVYSDMLLLCFSIQVTHDESQAYLLCEMCVWKLREAAQFRTQLELATKAFTLVSEQKSVLKESNISKINQYTLYDSTPANILVLNSHEDDSTGFENSETTDTKEPLQTSLSNGKRSNICPRNPINRIKIIRVAPKKIVEDVDLSLQSKVRIEKKKYPREKLPYKLEEDNRECKVCGEVFPYHRNLKMHMSVHYPNFICDQCAKPFATSLKLRKHMACVHSSIRYSCGKCHTKFKSWQTCKIHIQSHTEVVKRHVCSQCDMKFKSYHARRSHLVKIHGHEKYTHACKLCSNRYSNASHLRMHFRHFHMQQRNYTCNICKRAYFCSQTLRNHMYSHTGEKNHKCPVCSKKFSRRVTLRQHMRIHSVGQYICPVCKRPFTQKCTLKHHMTKIHPPEEIEN